MASHVAPGYNPEVSLLQGGNAPIVPVQGGGGMEAGASLPPDYNPSNSLLNTGVSATIVPVRGGGQSGGDGEKAYKDFYIERYEPELSSIDIPRPSPEATKATLLALIQNYKKYTEPKLLELTSFLRDPQKYVSDSIDNPLYKVCPTPGGLRNVPANFFQQVRKRVITISNENPTIWILPNINGEVSKFVQYMRLITNPDGTLKPNHFVICVGKFFSETTENNALLYIEFLKQKDKNKDSLFYLIDLTPQFMTAICGLYKLIYSEGYLTSPEGKNRPLTPFFEPDVIIFKKQNLILKSSELPVQKNDLSIRVSEMLKKTPPEKYASILLVPSLAEVDDVPGDKSDAPPDKKFFTFDFNPSLRKLVTFPTTTEIVCPTGKVCQNFKGGYKLENISDDKKLGDGAIYVIYKNTDKMPLLKEEGAALTPENAAKLVPKPTEAPKVPPKEEPKPPAVTTVEEPAKEAPLLLEKEEQIKIVPKERFEPTSTAFKTLEERTIEVNGFKFFIRFSLEDEKVKEDWKAGKFTPSETELLNILQITPSILAKTFGKKDAFLKLADFLEKIVLSNCFEDTALLSHAECSNAYEFVRQIYFTRLHSILETMYDEMGVLKPLNFMDVIFLLKNLLKEPGARVVPISPSEFKGDPFDPLKRICFSLDKDHFFADIAEIPPEILAGFKFYRVTKPSFEEVLEEIFTHIPETSPYATSPPPSFGTKDDSPKPPSLLERGRSLFKRAPSPPSSGPSFLNRMRGTFRSTSPVSAATRKEFQEALAALRRSLTPPTRRGFGSLFRKKPVAPTSTTAASSSAAASAGVPTTPENEAERRAAIQAAAAGTGLTLRTPPPPPLPPRRPREPPPPPPAEEEVVLVSNTPEAETYTLADIRGFSPPSSFFTTIGVKGDGLCFYRSVLKGLQTNPRSNSEEYNPTKEQTKTFVREIKAFLENPEERAKIRAAGATWETMWNAKFAPKAGEEKILRAVAERNFTQQERNTRVFYKGNLYKMTYQEYLDLLGSENPDDIPWADMDAGIGDATAAIKQVVLVNLEKRPTDYNVEAIYYEPKYDTQGIPPEKIIFLEHADANHWNLLKPKRGRVWPHVATGGGEEIFDLGEEMFDLGEPVKRRFTRRNKSRRQK